MRTYGGDINGGETLTIIIPMSRAYQFNEGNALKTLRGYLCPVRMFRKWKTITKEPTRVRSLVFSPHLRTRLSRNHKTGRNGM